MGSSNVVTKSLNESLPRISGRRREVRKTVRLTASIVTANGIANCHVNDLSTSGCRLYVVTPLILHQYLALEVNSADSTNSVCIRLAQVQWTKNQIAGVEFVYLYPTARQQLLQLEEDEVGDIRRPALAEYSQPNGQCCPLPLATSL